MHLKPQGRPSAGPVHISMPVAQVVALFLGPAPGRRGDRSGRLWWVCPFHPDRNPSLCVRPDSPWYRCFACNARGDAIDFVRRLDPSKSFVDAVAALGGVVPAAAAPMLRRPRRPPHAFPEGWQDFVQKLVDEGQAVLQGDLGEPARRYLAGRGLTEATIRAARLGLHVADTWHRRIDPEKPIMVHRGILIPWFSGDSLVAIKIRRPVQAGSKGGKYRWVPGSSQQDLYALPGGVPLGHPLIVTEGEFDCLLLTQELAGLAGAVTLGSASVRPVPRILDMMSVASPWYIAGDADSAGQKASESWLAQSARTRRVRVPGTFKDWTEAHQAGVNLRRWWGEVLAGVERPYLWTWDEVKSPDSLDVGRPFGARTTPETTP